MAVIDNPFGNPPAKPGRWWTFVTNERMFTDAALGVVTLESEYLGTNGDGAFVTGFEGYDPANGGYAPPVVAGDPHPVHAGLVATSVNWTADMDAPIRVQVKWSGTCPIVAPSHGEPWHISPIPEPGDRMIIKDITRLDCERCGKAIEGEGFKAGGWWSGDGGIDRCCWECADRDNGFRRSLGRAAAIGGLIAWGAGWWLYAASV